MPVWYTNVVHRHVTAWLGKTVSSFAAALTGFAFACLMLFVRSLEKAKFDDRCGLATTRRPAVSPDWKG